MDNNSFLSNIYANRFLCGSPSEKILYYYNFEQNTCRLLHVLAQFIFTTSETGLDYYHQKVIVWVAWQFNRTTYDWRSWETRKCKEMPEMLGLNGEHPASHQKAEFWCFFGKKLQ